MKKILVMSIGTGIGGIERSLIEFLKFISTQNCEISLYLWQEPGPLFEKIPYNVQIIERELYPKSFRYALRQKGFRKILFLAKYMGYRLTRFFGWATATFPRFKGDYDIAISFCHNGFSPEYVATKVKANKKYMFFRHGEYEYEKYPWRHYNKIYQKYDNVVTVSNATKDMLQRVFPSLKDILVIKNLFDEESVIKKSKVECETFLSNKPRLCSVGRISPEKGQIFALGVAQELKKRGWDFEWVFVGDGPDKEKCMRLLEEYKLQEHCRFVGMKTNPYPYMRAADIYVQTSYIEANPGTIQEAKILSKPIIASNIPSIEEVLKDGGFMRTSQLNAEDFSNMIMDMFNELQQCNKEKGSDDSFSENEESKRKIKEWLEI